MSENVEEILKVLDEVDGIVREKCSQLEKTLQQIDVYQEQMQTLRQKIIQEEQQLRVVMAPAYLANDRESAISEQQVCWTFNLSINNPYFLTTLFHACKDLGWAIVRITTDLIVADLFMKIYGIGKNETNFNEFLQIYLLERKFQIHFEQSNIMELIKCQFLWNVLLTILIFEFS